MVVNKSDFERRAEASRKSSSRSGFRLLLGDVCETVSVHSKQSTSKQKIDSMFDDTRSGMGNLLLNSPLEEEEDVSKNVISNLFKNYLMFFLGTQSFQLRSSSY